MSIPSQLTQGTTLNAGGQVCTVKELLGAGGQGEVYKIDLGGKEYALKWYFPSTATSELKNSLKNLVKQSAPTDRFLWPICIVEENDKFGYIMGLRPSEYKNFNGLLNRKYSLNYSKTINACLQLADGFRKLHAKGLSYQDISTGNVFLNPDDGSILICDNDNVTAHGDSTGGVLGTPKFMAPEIVRGEYKPDVYTDAYSMAVLLFYIMFLGHPLDGQKWVDIKCLDAPAMEKLYGKEPIFIFDPDNDQNRPVKDYHDNPVIFWNMYPLFIQNNFIKSFTKGLIDREQGRLLNEDWIDELRKLRESIIYCPKCQRENIYDLDKIKNPADKIFCWSKSCGNEIVLPPRIRLQSKKKVRYVMLNTTSKLYAYHLDNTKMDLKEGDEVIGEVVQNPKNPAIWGLRNLSSINWNYINDKGVLVDVVCGKAFTLKSGIEVNFGKTKGTIIG